MLCTEKEAEILISEYEKTKRPFPFRLSPTPYHIYVSEMMLQQTRMSTVLPYYERFIRKFPDMKSLALAPETDLLKAWEGLGYYNRVRNMKKAAQIVLTEFGGELPDTYEGLTGLPGIGAYTAGAILSIAYGKPYPVVDGNVIRIFLRFTASEENPKDEKVRLKFYRELFSFLENGRIPAGKFNEALMELGETVCLPKAKPICLKCPLRVSCEARKQGLTEELPVSYAKREKKTEKKTVFFLLCKKRIGLVKRKEGDVLSGLESFPMLDGHLSPKAVSEMFPDAVKLPDGKHVFTHKIWEMKAYRIRCTIEKAKEKFPGIHFVTAKELAERISLPSAYKKWSVHEIFTEDISSDE